jgi:alpha-L-rhamnosidase
VISEAEKLCCYFRVSGVETQNYSPKVMGSLSSDLHWVYGVKFEHYREPNTIGVQETKPRISWKIRNYHGNFEQIRYEIEITHITPDGRRSPSTSVKCASNISVLVPWPFEESLASRDRISVRVRVWDIHENTSAWSLPSNLEVGLLSRADWQCERIAAPWGPGTTAPDPEQLYRKRFRLDGTGDPKLKHARLYITSQGVYEGEINGSAIGDHFLAPGWTAYDGRLQYQTYDVTSLLSIGENCLGIRVAEGWFSGRIGFEGGHRNIWGEHTALMAQLEVTFSTGQRTIIISDKSWMVTEGPIRLAEIYDGEKYDATLEIPNWTLPSDVINPEAWLPVLSLPALPLSVELTAGFSEPVRRMDTIKPIEKIWTHSGKLILDFGQNLVGFLNLTNISGQRGQQIVLSHAEVLENGELGTRPLRICKATDMYTIKGSEKAESYAPRFTFHGFRYAQIDGWPGQVGFDDIQAIVCHTDMKPAGSFECSEPLLNQLYSNIRWSMRGNFLSVPTDCPQRDERLGWTGDLALFISTATLIYDCFGMIKNWLIDLEHDQMVLNGVPPMVSPNATVPDPIWCRKVPCAIWHDSVILVPWELYQETGDESILARQYNSMTHWMTAIPKGKSGGGKHLWDEGPFQLGVSIPIPGQISSILLTLTLN